MRVLWYRPQVGQEKAICLTFADGPNGVATRKVLDVLRRHQLHATFFVIGKNVERDPDLTRRIVQEGHVLGNHSYRHENFLAFYSTARMRRSLERTNQLIAQATGVSPRYFRPPNGLMTTRLKQVCAELGLTPIGVHVFVHDSFSTNPDHIAQRILRNLRGGTSIIVLHDGFGTRDAPSRTVVADALERLIPELERQGYRWVTLDEVSASGPTL